MRGGMVRAWRWQWAAFGRNADRNADCRGGVFAVFAKIPPPTCPPHARILPRPPFPVVISRMVMSARVVFVCRVAIKNHRIAIKNNRIVLPKSRVAIKITASRFRNCLALQTLLAFQASHRLCEFCMRLTPPRPLQQKKAMRPSRTTLLIQSLLPLRARSPAAGWPSDDARKRSCSSPCLCRGRARRQSRGT